MTKDEKNALWIVAAIGTIIVAPKLIKKFLGKKRKLKPQKQNLLPSEQDYSSTYTLVEEK